MGDKSTLKVLVNLPSLKDSNWRICKSLQNEQLKHFSLTEDMYSVAAQSSASWLLGQQKWKAFSLEKVYPEIHPSAAW